MNELENDFTIRFWGVRGSYPTPRGNAMRYGGNTACVEVVAGGQTIIFDAGTGIIPLGKSLPGGNRPDHAAAQPEFAAHPVAAAACRWTPNKYHITIHDRTALEQICEPED